MINNVSIFINTPFVVLKRPIMSIQCTKQIVVQNIYILCKIYPFLYTQTPFNEMIAVFYMTTDP